MKTEQSIKRKYPELPKCISASKVLCKDRKTELGKFITDCRFVKKLSIGDLSKRTNIISTRCYYFENKDKGEYRHIPFIHEILRIAEVLEINPDTLYEMSFDERMKAYIRGCYKKLDSFLKKGTPRYAKVFTSEFKHSFPKRTFKKVVSIFIEERENKNLSKLELSKQCEISYDWLSEFELGNTRPAFPHLKKLCDFLGINITNAFRMFVKESAEYWEKRYYEEYEIQKGERKRKEIKKIESYKSRVPLYLNTATSNYFYEKRVERKLSRRKIQKMGMSPTTLIKFEEGSTVFGFKDILFFSELFGDSLDELFEMSILDAKKIFTYKHNIKFKMYFDYKMMVNCEKYPYMLSPQEWHYKKDIIAVYSRSASELIKMRKSKGFSTNEVAKKIGIKRSVYLRYERGEYYPGFLIISACKQLYGTNIKEFYNMIMDERIIVWTNIYRKIWKRYPKHKKMIRNNIDSTTKKSL